ncbi:MAG: permease-like cell division protein FtsX [Bacteroidales bacterium]|nr:permease-like cell division protein FtsX [Bacteroidales bacterium]MCF8386257.1 permease-like cell division protein FtsX [Bacteroidales bacterium]MCF8397510.1 permease-like cell division protein FtsX [Bacteroidales bacterium]
MSKQEEKYTKRRYRASYVTTVVSITLVLFMMGMLGLIILHANKLSEYVKENIGFSIIMKDGVKEAGIIQLQKTLDASAFVKSTEYITKEKAAEIMQKDLGEDFIEFLGYNPLLPSIDLRLRASYANVDSLQKIEQQLLRNSNVKEVWYQKSLVHLINKNIRRIAIILLAFSLLLLLIAIALINNTIRLSVYSKRFLIRSMQLVGATQKFIRKPFILQGLMQGILAALLAILFLMGIIYLSRTEVPELIILQDLKMYISLFVIVIILGLIISYFSTYFAVRKYLKMRTDDLYF